MRTWPNINSNSHEAAPALCASLLLHALLIVILSTTSTFYFLMGKERRFDLFWLSTEGTQLSSPLLQDEAAEGEPQETVQPPSGRERPQPLARQDLPVLNPPEEDDAGDGSPPEADTLPSHETAEEEPEGALAMSIPAPTRQPAPAAAPIRHDPAFQPAAPVRHDPALAQRDLPVEEGKAKDPVPRVQSARFEPAPPPQPVTAKPAPNPVQQPRQVAAKPAPKPVQQQKRPLLAAAKKEPVSPGLKKKSQSAALIPATAPKPLPTVPKPGKEIPYRQAGTAPPASLAASASVTGAGSHPGGGRPPATRAAENKAPSTVAKAIAAPPVTAAASEDASSKHSEKPHEPRGMVIPSVRGDLKMVVSGDSGIKLYVLFREYPKSRRKTVQTRAETRREQKITPVVIRTGEGTREVVIETAGEGIYIFSAEGDRGEAAKAKFTLKIFENAPREKVAAIGSRSVTGKSTLAKVLMPEAILWDDDSAFTGSLEDSDSTTKFNPQTGVYWKEYND